MRNYNNLQNNPINFYISKQANFARKKDSDFKVVQNIDIGMDLQ